MEGRKTKSGLKKELLLLTAIIFMMLATGCEKKAGNVFHICGQDLSYEETLVFGYIYGMEYNLNASVSFDELYDGSLTYGQYCKQQIHDEIVDTMLLCHQAKEKGLSLSSEEKDTISTEVSGLMAYYGKDIFEKMNITEKDIKDVYEMKCFAQKYSEQLTAGEEEEGEPAQYVKVYQVTFLTAKLDGNGNYDLDENGNVMMLDASAISQKAEEAREFSVRVQDGEDIQTLVNEYSSAIGVEKYLKYQDLPEEYKKAVDGLSVGKTSDAFSFEYGYYVIQLLQMDDKEYANIISHYDEATANDAKRQEELERLKDTNIGNSTDYIEEEWDDIDIHTFVK